MQLLSVYTLLAIAGFAWSFPNPNPEAGGPPPLDVGHAKAIFENPHLDSPDVIPHLITATTPAPTATPPPQIIGVEAKPPSTNGPPPINAPAVPVNHEIHVDFPKDTPLDTVLH